MKKILFCLLLAIAWLPGAFAQNDNLPVSKEIFYLMDDFKDGYVFYQGKAPVKGKFNICAVDGTVRFMDKGTELAADDDGSLTRVNIDGVEFVRKDDRFARIYPFNDNFSLAYLREVIIMNDSRVGAYGVQDNTSAITEYSSIMSAGQVYTLERSQDAPCRVRNTAFIYDGGQFVLLNKKNCQKYFPNSKSEIDTWFKENKRAFSTADIDSITEVLKSWDK